MNKEAIKSLAIVVLLLVLSVLVTGIVAFSDGVNYGQNNATKLSQVK